MQFYAFTGWEAHEPATAQRRDEILLLLGLPVQNCFCFERLFEIKLVGTPLESTVIYKPNLPFKLFHCNIGNSKGNFRD